MKDELNMYAMTLHFHFAAAVVSLNKTKRKKSEMKEKIYTICITTIRTEIDAQELKTNIGAKKHIQKQKNKAMSPGANERGCILAFSCIGSVINSLCLCAIYGEEFEAASIRIYW